MSGDAGGEGDRDSWRAARHEVVAEQAAALARRKLAESTQARALLASFVQDVGLLGEPAVPLRAQCGRTTYRTALTGWYLKKNRSLAVDTTGSYYVLSIPNPGLRARVTGVTLAPAEPALAVGVGARDGESMSLRELLERRLREGP